jgi:hypothetical protein
MSTVAIGDPKDVAGETWRRLNESAPVDNHGRTSILVAMSIYFDDYSHVKDVGRLTENLNKGI